MKQTMNYESYKNYINELYTNCKALKKFTFTDLRGKHKVSAVVNTIMLRKGIYKKVNGKIQWDTIEPNALMIRAIMDEARTYMNESSAKSYQKEKALKAAIKPKRKYNRKPIVTTQQVGDTTTYDLIPMAEVKLMKFSGQTLPKLGLIRRTAKKLKEWIW